MVSLEETLPAEVLGRGIHETEDSIYSAIFWKIILSRLDYDSY